MSSPTLPTHLAGQLDVLMIDNFDSFTWNLYQQLCLLGAEVTVIRNDAIDPSLLPQLKIKYLIVSPGPGHPQTDSGISKAAIDYFQGKIPILGVCMGLECLVDLHGGEIGFAGEIVHGKVSRVRHDNRGCFKGVPQGIQSTRYHSLSASSSTLPANLAITAITEDSGVIMAVRHRKYTLEAVQYHPESVLSEGGTELMRNFLSLRGGTWDQNPESGVLDNTLPPFEADGLGKSNTALAAKIPTILEKIYAQRLKDVAQARATPGTSFEDLQTILSLNIAPPLISFLDRLKQDITDHPALLAEIKRASPSKGPISVKASAPSQALTYALAGANAISVLTEPKWFLGSLADMLHARQAVTHLPNRPAILRKDFILSRYQIMESRIWGADTVLLIVSMLPEVLLRDLYRFSLELGMEPLVEVNNAKEMELALSLPAKVIGVNNRNLHDFQVDMGTTTRLSQMTQGKDVILCALSGISTAKDVQKFAADGVGAVLIGESLMRATDPAQFIRQLFSLPEPQPSSTRWGSPSPLVKICGVRSTSEALAIAEAGADLLGLMFVSSSKRHITIDTARDISHVIRSSRFTASQNSSRVSDLQNLPWFTSHATRLATQSLRPQIVGVFQDAPLAEILHAVSYCQLDIVQLHGSEPVDWAIHIPVPVIRVFHVGHNSTHHNITLKGYHQFILLDSMRDDGSKLSGGTGKTVNWGLAKSLIDRGEIVTDSYKAIQEAGDSTPAGSESQPTSGQETSDTDNSSSTSKVPSNLTHMTPAKYPLPIILAGGLTVDNISDAVSQVGPWAVDISGGVETEDGTGKDLEKVRLFIQRVKQTSTPSEAQAVVEDEVEGQSN